MLYVVETVITGLLVGSMYSLVAIGFVLIFKASAVFNFAQGVMCLFAALTLVGLMTGTVPFTHGEFGFALSPWLAVPATCVVMFALAWLIERLMLRHLINQEPIQLFMATIGLAFVLEGVGEMLWGADVKLLDVGLPQGPVEWLLDDFNLFVERLEVAAALLVAALLALLAAFFRCTRTGMSLRAVADDHQAALSVGISLRAVWVTVWTIAGVVALVAGVVWGSKSGVQFSLSLVALKALPVLILGGFTSVPGAVIGGLIIGVGEKLAEVYLGGILGGALESWFAYALALLFLLVRPQGLFGERIIERV